MKARCWINGENMPPNHEFEVYHATNQSWKIPLFHSHDTYEFYFFIRGDMRIGIEGGFTRLFPMTCLSILPDICTVSFQVNRSNRMNVPISICGRVCWSGCPRFRAICRS